jgi:hypothetical protein
MVNPEVIPRTACKVFVFGNFLKPKRPVSVFRQRCLSTLAIFGA